MWRQVYVFSRVCVCAWCLVLSVCLVISVLSVICTLVGIDVCICTLVYSMTTDATNAILAQASQHLIATVNAT